MVRAYPPHAFHGSVAYNTNYPPQSDNEGGGGSPIPPDAMRFNNTNQPMLFNNDLTFMEFN